MGSHHDYGIDCEHFCGGTPDDEPAPREWTDADWHDYYRWLDEVNAKTAAAQDPTPPEAWDGIPF